MNDTKKLIALICAFAAVAAALLAVLIYFGTTSGNISELPSHGGIPVIPSAGGDAVSSTENTALYFRFGESNMLGVETQTLTGLPNMRIEYIALNALISGPASSKSELTSVIDPHTRIVQMTDEGSTLYVTLSSEFLRQSSDLPDGWGEDAALKEEEYLRRRLAYYSVINTLTGIGNYSHVEILIDEDGSGAGNRVSRARMGFADDMAMKDRPLDPAPYDDAVVLSAPNTVSTLLRMVLMHDWDSAYAYIAPSAENGISRPLTSAFTAELLTLVQQLRSFEVAGVTYAYDGASAVVRVNVEYTDASGATVRRSSYPLKLRAIGELWKLDYDRLTSLFTGG